jgi:sulfur carrier protein
MNVFINQIPHQLPTDAVALLQMTPPFASAVNLQFVPRTQYAQTPLRHDDRIDIIAPVTGG